MTKTLSYVSDLHIVDDYAALPLPSGFSGFLDVNYSRVPVVYGDSLRTIIQRLADESITNSIPAVWPTYFYNLGSNGHLESYSFSLYSLDRVHGYVFIRNTSSPKVLNALGIVLPNTMVYVDDSTGAKLPDDVPPFPADLLGNNPPALSVGDSRDFCYEIRLEGKRRFTTRDEPLDLPVEFDAKFYVNYGFVEIKYGDTLQNVVDKLSFGFRPVNRYLDCPIQDVTAFILRNEDEEGTYFTFALKTPDWHHGYIVVRSTTDPAILKALGLTVSQTPYIWPKDYGLNPPEPPADLLNPPILPPVPDEPATSIPRPPKVLFLQDVRILQTVKQSPWTVKAKLTVLSQVHSNRNINLGYYSGRDVAVGDWVATGGKGRAVQVVSLIKVGIGSVECVLEDTDKINECMSDQVNFLNGGIWQGPGVLFEVINGTPALYPLPDVVTTNFPPTFASQLYSRFLSRAGKTSPEKTVLILAGTLQPNEEKKFDVFTGSRIILTHLSANVAKAQIGCHATITNPDPNPYVFVTDVGMLEDDGIYINTETNPNVTIRGTRFINLLNLDNLLGDTTSWKVKNVNQNSAQNIIVTIRFIPI